MQKLLPIGLAFVIAACGGGDEGDLRTEVADFLEGPDFSYDADAVDCIADTMVASGLTQAQFDEAEDWDGTEPVPVGVELYQEARDDCGEGADATFDSIVENIEGE